MNKKICSIKNLCGTSILPMSRTIVIDSNILPLKEKRAFTLAEVLITLSILGVVAAITIPSAIIQQSEKANKTKIKKAMAAYEKVINQMVVENDLWSTSALQTWANANTCANSTQYFKKVEGTNCKFRTADGVWWDITDITEPIVAFNSDDCTSDKPGYGENKAFRFISSIDSNNIVRVNDMGNPSCSSWDDGYCYDQKLRGLLNYAMGTTYGDTCLLKGTLITMADGTQKPIECIEQGDLVLSVNPETWELEPTVVLASDSNMVKFANESDKWYFEDGTIVETAHRHRFYNLEANAVKYMDEWQIGEHACKSDGTNPKLVKHEKIDGDCQHYTLFTANQTYFANGLMSGNRHTLAFGSQKAIQQKDVAMA